jgi:1-acyl-sn-glycerol-3-phosphate acyltransferase
MSSEYNAVIFLWLVAIGVTFCVLRFLLRKPLHPVQNGFMLLDKLLTTFLWRTTSNAFPHVPDRGLLVVCNHGSSADPFFVQRGTTRPIYWMVAREFVEHPAFRWFLKNCEVIPVNRGGVDTAAIKLVIRRVSQGNAVGMFPEGRINMSEKLFLPGRPGAASIAMKAGGCLLPCYIQDAPYDKVAWSPFFMPSRVRVRYGEIIDAAPYANRVANGEDEPTVAAELLLRVMKVMAQLADQPDFEPELAGKNWKPTAAEVAQAILEAESRKKRR